MRMEHKKTAMKLWIPETSIFLTDNGDIVDIDEKGRVICGQQKIRLEEIIVDGHGIGLAKSHVIEARRQMGKSGAVIIIFRVNATTREIDGPLKIETRWVAYLDEAREIHRLIIQKAKTAYSETVKDVPDIEEKDLVKIIKKDVESFLSYKIDRDPIVIPVIMAI
jgi:mRNA degradation ribonuclease J1/J2